MEDKRVRPSIARATTRMNESSRIFMTQHLFIISKRGKPAMNRPAISRFSSSFMFFLCFFSYVLEKKILLS